MRKTKDYMEKYMGVKCHTIDLYLCRPEFSHIKKRKERKICYYDNLTFEDLEKLRLMILNRRYRY